MMNNKRIKDLEGKISDLNKRWPAHSVPAALLQELDVLEEELAKEYEKIRREDADA